MGDRLGDLARRLARRIFHPRRRQVEPPGERAAHLRGAKVQAHRDLAVGQLAERAAILPGHADGRLARFGKGSLIDHPNLRLAQGIDHLLRQRALHLLDRPGALAGKLPQGLHVGAHARRHRLDGLALAIEQQAFEILARPMAPLAAPERGEQLVEKSRESSIEGRKRFWSHGRAACHRRARHVNHLTQYY